MDSIVEVQNPNLDQTGYVVPYTRYLRQEKGAEGSKNIIITNNGVTTVEITIPGNNYLNLYETEIQYTMAVPASGDAADQYLLATDSLKEIKSFSAEFTDTSEKIVNIEDIPKYTKQQCASKLNFRKRSLKDRLYFNSSRTLLPTDVNHDPKFTDPFYQMTRNIANGANWSNGFPVESFNTHSNVIVTGNAITSLKFNYKLRDVLPNTYFEMNHCKKYNSPILLKFSFNTPNATFLTKTDNAGAVAIIAPNAAGGIAIDNVPINDIKIGYYVLKVDETDSESVLAKLANSTYNFYYPCPVTSVLPITGAGEQSIVSRVSANQGITIYKVYASLFKNHSVAGYELQANSANFDGQSQKWDRVVYNDGTQSFELRLDNRTYHQFIKGQLGDNHSFSTDDTYENYGSIFYIYDTSSDPNTEYEQMMLKGRRITDGTIETSFLFNVLPNAGAGHDGDNTQDKYYHYINAIVYKKGVYDHGNIKL